MKRGVAGWEEREQLCTYCLGISRRLPHVRLGWVTHLTVCFGCEVSKTVHPPPPAQHVFRWWRTMTAASCCCWARTARVCRCWRRTAPRRAAWGTPLVWPSTRTWASCLYVHAHYVLERAGVVDVSLMLLICGTAAAVSTKRPLTMMCLPTFVLSWVHCVGARDG
jgi:hypothetical protein